MSDQMNNAQVCLEAGMHTGDPKTASLNGIPYAVIPMHAQVVDLEKLLENPARKRDVVVCKDLPSFVTYLEKHRTDATVIFATVPDFNIDAKPSYTAVLDYHEAGATGKPGWAQHIVRFTPDSSPAWDKWRGAHGKWWQQADFAGFLEDQAVDIVMPDAATIIEVARCLHASKNATFRSGVNLHDGTVQFTYEETHTTSAGKAALTVPQQFTIELPVFARGQRYQLPVRLRYRIDDNRALVFRCDIAQIDRVWEKVGEELTDLVRKAVKCDLIIGERRT